MAQRVQPGFWLLGCDGTNFALATAQFEFFSAAIKRCIFGLLCAFHFQVALTHGCSIAGLFLLSVAGIAWAVA